MTQQTTSEPALVEFAPPDVDEDDIEAVVKVLRSGWLTTGPECARFEAELAAYLGAPHVIGVSSCTAALEICLAYLRLPVGSKVAVPTWTFASTGISAHHQGLQVVLVDVDPDTLNMSVESLASAFESHQIAAVVPVHIAGHPVDASIRRLCEQKGVPVVEDAAHALGAVDDRGRINGVDVTASCFSFYVTKNLSSAEGGAIATFDDELARFARVYRLHGLDADAWARYKPGGKATYDLLLPGIKANLPDLLAALGRSQLKKFEAMQLARRLLVNRYRQNIELIERVRPVPAVQAAGSADHLMVVVLDDGVDRDVVRKELTERRIVTSVHFRPLHTYEWFRENAIVPAAGLRHADALAPQALSLPLHPGLTLDDVDRVCAELSTVTG